MRATVMHAAGDVRIRKRSRRDDVESTDALLESPALAFAAAILAVSVDATH